MLNYSDLWSIQEPILAMAAIIETYIHFSGRIKKWKETTAEWWVNIQLIKWPDRLEINKKFQELFNTIYGSKLFSTRRIISSTISSFFFVIISYIVVLRVFQIYLGGTLDNYGTIQHVPPWLEWCIKNGDTVYNYSFKSIAILIHDSIGFNLLPDLISIAETGWIIKKASTPNSNLIYLIILDLILTTVIVTLSHSIAYYYTTAIEMGEFGAIPLSLWYSVHYPSSSAYFISSYSTSLLWILFVFTVLVISPLKRISKLMVKVIEHPIVTELPVFLIFGIPCLLSWPILYIIRVFIS